MNNILSLLLGAFTIMTPILFAAAGGLFPALAGTLNIALEGLLLAGAFTALAVFYQTSSIALAVTAAAGASLLLSAMHAFTIFKLRANVFISGLAVNLFTGGLCVVLSGKLFNTRGVVSVHEVHMQPYWFTIMVLILLALSWLAIYKTPFGYRLRACDKSSEALLSLGINVQFYQIAALLISGIFCGIGGSFLSLRLGAFIPGMSSGRGWIALVIIFLGGRKPQGILAAAFVYGLVDAFSNRIQGIFNIPADFVLAFPFVCILLAMIAQKCIGTYKNSF